MRILLAEDSPVYQHLIGCYLKEWGFDFVLARDGRQAWKLLNEPDSPKLALLDWVLPGMDGIEVCKHIRGTDLRDRYIYTVLLTGKSDKNDLLRAMEAGADDYLVKPFDAPELRARLLVGKRILDLHNQLFNAQESLRFSATHDFLTNLWNRAEIVAFLTRELGRARRDSTPVSIILLDVDHFKSINDSRGHHTGDMVLKELASLLRSKLRTYDGVGRYGGEEFLLVLPGCNLQASLLRAEEIRQAISQISFAADLDKVSVTASMGITVAKGGATDFERLLHEADTALYRAKDKGRNRVEYCALSTERILSPIS